MTVLLRLKRFNVLRFVETFLEEEASVTEYDWFGKKSGWWWCWYTRVWNRD